MYKALFRPHLDYFDIFCDKPGNESFKNWLEKIQYNADPAIKDDIGGTPRKCICNELGLESLADRQ